MRNKIFNFNRPAFVLTGIMPLVLVGCASLSNVKPDGTTDKVVWPDVNRVTFDNKQGIYPTQQSISLIRAGMTRDQIYHLLGRPHFNEGFGTREWDYLMHFPGTGPGDNGVTRCQFKILFDAKKLVRNLYWKPVDNQSASCPPGAAAQTYTLNADALFEFDRSSLSGMTAGRQALTRLAESLASTQGIRLIVVTGHTDRLGSDAYNQRLSKARADTVRSYLIRNGVAADLIHSQGLGKSQPVTQCNGSGAALIRCLAPNRRVEVTVEK
ncbi:OmpA family protein [Advenella mimigardefordensis]|uniref:Putative outer membrane protein, OmpA family n=1 Tax=Advenella mimigardefordensis (strain DSM 17166 / LMG 22922 / DPN7) TaxID=1247726 RepID=W0PBU2_ADVMD|nr:OmpA family protein [Advenella mimigardefordensis]AHG62890.1 putative outer membrane protein, OmpA family [Advenella mimigardefordensis DPN7]